MFEQTKRLPELDDRRQRRRSAGAAIAIDERRDEAGKPIDPPTDLAECPGRDGVPELRERGIEIGAIQVLCVCRLTLRQLVQLAVELTHERRGIRRRTPAQFLGFSRRFHLLTVYCARDRGNREFTPGPMA